MEPKLSSNPYKQSALQFEFLFMKEAVKKYWFVVYPFFGLLIGKMIYDIIVNPSVSHFIYPLFLVAVMLIARHFFISGFKNNPIFKSKRILMLFEHCIEIKDETGSEGVFFFVDMDKVVSSKKQYHVRLKTKQTFWIPKSCFKTPEDRMEFELLLKEKGKMK